MLLHYVFATCGRLWYWTKWEGGGLYSRGDSHTFSIEYRALKFGDTERWEVVSLVLDGEELAGGRERPLNIRQAKE